MTKTEIGTWLEFARQRLAGTTQRPHSEAQAILSSVTGQPRAWLAAHPEAPLSEPQIRQLDALLERLATGEPLPYVLGQWEFYGLEFVVTPAVLIPRPETELLVETALTWLQNNPDRRSSMDIGTGSGCIAISMAWNCADLQVTATDISLAALEIAGQNIRRYRLAERVKLQQADLLDGVRGAFDLVCANLPYIPSQTLEGLPVSRYEPRSALDGGEHGLDLIARLLEDLDTRLLDGGLALLEIEAGQGASAAALARQYLPGATACVQADLAGRPRLLSIVR